VKVAGKFPDVKFEHAHRLQDRAEHDRIFNARFYEGRYVIQGQIAAKQSKSRTQPAISCRSRSPKSCMGINSFVHAGRAVR
jgi:simple sugar transport system substrate-binding protein